MKKILALALAVLASLFSIACKGKVDERKFAAATEAVPPPVEVRRPDSIGPPEPYYAKRAKEAIAAYHVSPDLDKLEAKNPRDQSGLQEVVGMSLTYFVSEPGTYNEDEALENSEYGDIPEVRRRARDHVREVMVAYGIFQTGNNPVRQSYLKHAVTLLWQERLRETAYRLTVPSIREALVTMPRKDRDDYLGILRHTSAYMATFNLARETEYLTYLKGSACQVDEKYRKEAYQNRTLGIISKCDEFFTIFGPDGKRNPYRKTEAFVYRRVAEGWKLAEMKRVLDRLIADLS